VRLYFSPYGAGCRPVPIRALFSKGLRGRLFARAENSGCEGCYIEVAIWNEKTLAWERFCFEKVFGGEIREDIPRAYDTARWMADKINNWHRNESVSFIHNLEDWGGQAAKTFATNRCVDDRFQEAFDEINPKLQSYDKAMERISALQTQVVRLTDTVKRLSESVTILIKNECDGAETAEMEPVKI
jgi:hypothetical protein